MCKLLIYNEISTKTKLELNGLVESGNSQVSHKLKKIE